MTAEEAALIMMSGGGKYTNEGKTITSNGEYEPDEGVRWDKVTVDIPIGASICEAIKKLPVRWGGILAQSYHYYIHIGDLGFGAYNYIGSYPDYEPAQFRTKYVNYTTQRGTRLQVFFAVYANDTNEMLFARCIGTVQDTYDLWSTRYAVLMPDTGGPPTEGTPIEPYHSATHAALATYIEGDVHEQYRYSDDGRYDTVTYTIPVRTQQRSFYYLDYDKNSGEPAPPDTVNRVYESTYSVTCYITFTRDSSPNSLEEYTPLSIEAFAKAYLDFVNELIPIRIVN